MFPVDSKRQVLKRSYAQGWSFAPRRGVACIQIFGSEPADLADGVQPRTATSIKCVHEGATRKKVNPILIFFKRGFSLIL